MSSRNLFQSFLRGWLPRNPLDFGQSSLLTTKSHWASSRMLRYGGISGIVWSTLNLLITAGIFNVVGRTSIWYHAIDTSLSLTAILFYFAINAGFHGLNHSRTRIAVVLGVAGISLRLGIYVAAQSIIAFHDTALLQELSGAKVFVWAEQLSAVLVGLSAVTLSALVSGGFLKALSIIAGGLAAANGLFTLIFQYYGGSLLGQMVSTSTLISIMWVMLMSVSFLYLGRVIGWKFGLTAVAIVLLVESLVVEGIIWLPNFL